MRYTPENITFLKVNEIFVFGSNAKGMIKKNRLNKKQNW